MADKLAREVTMITVMNLECQCWFVLISALSLGSTAVAHPSSGIAVTELGEVFFVHTTRGVAKLDHAGKLTYIHTNSGGHWLCLDRHGSFSRTQPKHFLRITADGVRPGIIFADGGAPIAVCEHSNLYYGSGWGGGHEHEPGGATVSRLTPKGTLTAFTPQLKEILAKRNVGVTGLSAGSDGALYVTSAIGVYKVEMNGNVTTLAERPEVQGCDADPPPDGLPGFRGLDVTDSKTVYAAATGCRAVLKIERPGVVKTVLRADRPWSPTSVAAHKGDLYVLEWTNPNDGPEAGWRPRVRKVDANGKTTTLITIVENVTVNLGR